MPSSPLLTLPPELLVRIFGYFCLHCQGEHTRPWDAAPLKPRIGGRPGVESEPEADSEPPSQQQQQQHLQKSSKPSWYALDRQTLVSLCLVSRHIRHIAQDVLHHEFVLGWGDSWRSDLFTWQRRLVSFMRTIAARPHLASRVHVVYLHASAFLQMDPALFRPVLLESAAALGIDLRAAWHARVEHISDQERADWPEMYDFFIRYFLDGDDDGDAPGGPETWPEGRRKIVGIQNTRFGSRWVYAEHVALLLAHLPNLHHLAIDARKEWPSQGLPMTALEALGITSLPLRRVDAGVYLKSACHLSRNLRELNLDFDEVRGAGIGTNINMPSLEILRMTKGMLSAADLANLLSSCTGSLRTFAYEIDCRVETLAQRFGQENDFFQPSEAVRLLLQTHGSTLRYLHLDLNSPRFISRLDAGVDFTKFASLEHLALSTTVIYDRFSAVSISDDSEAVRRLLPPSIRSLSFLGDFNVQRLETGLVGLSEYMKKHPTALPHLEQIFQSTQGFTYGPVLGHMLGEAGVRLQGSSCPLSEAKPYLNGSKPPVVPRRFRGISRRWRGQ